MYEAALDIFPGMQEDIHIFLLRFLLINYYLKYFPIFPLEDKQHKTFRKALSCRTSALDSKQQRGKLQEYKVLFFPYFSKGKMIQLFETTVKFPLASSCEAA
eukprot:snap_masked-scaffold_64-processed-gene-0.89-mRNA-1 protein AED:1.00 eAED:1.00 QI:0/0/0/0/1/1/3/0/101